MVEVECRTRREGDVTLVAAVVANRTEVRRRVRLESALEGPVLPPRRRGVPAEGWDDGGVELVLAAGEREGVGFAATAPPASPPVEVVTDERVLPDEPASDGGEDADALVRRLGRAAPPRDTVPATAVNGPGRDDPAGSGSDADVPPPVAEWLAAVEERVTVAEACADAETLADATAAVGDAGGVDAVETAVERVDDDAATLRAVERRAAALAERAAASADAAPVGALRTLS
ncbi:DUF7857 domain-containing protein [Halostella litorea]|uniref:DUF7857 domain-containing protein n=1 Tax=Halostella litorea TaxID=2528831 RepID=UPI0010930DFA|nr:hypothetical protein [Halostella litorea]